MDKETMDLLLKQIKEGRYVTDTYCDVQKLLTNAGMELYAKPCCDRIEDAGLVDGIHISHLYPSLWNLQMDASGMKACEKILKAYIQPECLEPLQETLQKYHTWNTAVNNTLYLLRKADAKELKAGDLKILECQIKTEDEADALVLLKTELKYRRFPFRLYRTVKGIAFVSQMLVLFRGPVRLLVPLIKEAWKEWSGDVDMPDNEGRGSYGKALARFLKVHGISAIDKLQKDDLVKYVYLAVKAYGKENRAEINHCGTKSCLEIEKRYAEIKTVMEAIGRLTPKQLVHMYPIEKEFDGERWGRKDYFYTMKSLKQYSEDKPIGDAQDVACLMWDYQNWDLTFLLLQWQNVIGDLYIYCNNKEPQNEFYERYERRMAQES